MLPRPVIDLIEAQLGLVARRQLVARLGEARADVVLRGPWFESCGFGVHRVVGGARPREQAALAAWLRAGRGATLTGPVVLSLSDVDGFSGSEPFEVLVPAPRRVTGVTFPVRTDPDVTRAVDLRGEVRIADPVDALIDSAAFVQQIGVRRLRLAHDVLRWRGQLHPGRLLERVEQLGVGRSADASLVALLELDRQAATGDGERRLGELLARFDPAPEPQHWVTPRRRVDWWFPTLRYALEYQGSVDHGTLPGRSKDATRDRELRQANVRVGYVTARELRDEGVLLATVAASLTAGAHELGVAAPRLRAT
jgi:hypothetical protein